MKKLTDSHKKWALTACLASVLSFNLVMNLGAGTIAGSANFASSEKVKDAEASEETNIRYESLISDRGEQLKVKYIQEDDEKTLAIVPEKTESGLCFSCGSKYLLPKNFDSSKGDLEMALRKAMHQQGKSANSEGEDLDEKISSKRRPRVDMEEQEKVSLPEINPELQALQKRCESREEQSRLNCFANGLTRLLKDKKKDFDKEEVMDLFREEIEPGLIAGLRDVSDLVSMRRHNSNDPFADIESDNTSRRQETQDLVEDMIAKISKKHNYLRMRLTTLAAKAVLSNQEQAQMKLKQAEQMKATDPNRALMLQTEGYARLNASNQIANQIGGSLYSGFETAQWTNKITQDQFDNLYYDNYAKVVNSAIQGLAANPLTYVIPSVTLSNGSVVVDQNGQSFTLTPRNSPVVQQNLGGNGIIVISNGLTASNVANANVPRLSNIAGTSAPGTATIQVISGAQSPSAPQPTGMRMRGQ